MQISELYRALSDESRLRIINALQFGVFNVQELTSILGLSQPTISHHLKILNQSGVVSAEKTGTWIYYRLNQNSSSTPISKIVHNLLDVLATHTEELDTALAADTRKIRSLLDQRRDKAKAFFDSAAPDWKNLRAEIQGGRSYFDELRELVKFDDTLLELGCGGGAFLDAITPRKGSTIGVDYSEAMLESAKKLLGKKSSTVDLRLGYLEHLPIGDESVDVAVSYMVLHHITDPRKVLTDTYRVLKPESSLVIVELTKHANEQMREKFSDLWLGFDHAEISKWARDAGFTKVTTRTLDADGKVFLLTALKQ